VVLATGELWLFPLQFPLANLCMCVLFARPASGANPLVARLAAEVVALRQPATHHPGLHRSPEGPAPGRGVGQADHRTATSTLLGSRP
jgi:hypothetical protein